MIKLHEVEYSTRTSKKEAIEAASFNTGFSKEDFKCETLKEPIKIGLFKKEPGIFHCWYEYEGMNCDKEIGIADATLYFDFEQQKILVTRYGFKAYEIDYSDMTDYEIIVASNSRTYTIGNSNNALTGALLFGVTGAVVGASQSKVETETVDLAELIIRLKFRDKEPFEILTCNYRYEVDEEEWRNVVDQSKVVDEVLRKINRHSD